MKTGLLSPALVGVLDLTMCGADRDGSQGGATVSTRTPLGDPLNGTVAEVATAEPP